MIEIWKNVIGYENYYEVSNLGNIRSIERNYIDKIGRNRYVKSIILKKQLMNKGYYKVDLTVNNYKKSICIHVLIAKAFINNPENKLTVNHKNGIKTDCSIENLEWATYSENNKHATDNNLRSSRLTGKFGINNPFSKEVIQLDLNNIEVNRFVNSRIATEKTGISYKHISSCCLGKRKTTGGYMWKYAYINNIIKPLTYN